MAKIIAYRLALAVMIASVLAPCANADVTSPSIKDRGKKYSHEKPNSAYYGTGSAARLVEASELRFKVDELLQAGEWEKALPIVRKAVQLDPGDPTGHLYLARTLTMKFYQSKGAPDERTMEEAMREWEMIRRHDADPNEQWEAGTEVKKMRKIAKILHKEKIKREREEELKRQEEELQREEEELAKAGSERVARASTRAEIRTKTDSTKAGNARTTSPESKLAAKKRRFGLF